MRALLQRVNSASVEVDTQQISAIGQGLLVFLGVLHPDNEVAADWLLDKLCTLRIFPGTGLDGGDIKPMNRSVIDISGEILVVSQFTLAADVSRGRRPGFSSAADPQQAECLYEYFLRGVEDRLGKVSAGVFGADMQVQLVNDGPITFMLENPDPLSP